MPKKAADAFRTISEVSEWLGVSPHVLRFWESKFTQVKPVKRAGGRRYYRPSDMELLGGIRKLLHDDGLTVKGVQKVLKEQGARSVASMSPEVASSGEMAPANPIFRAPKPKVELPPAETTGQKDPASLPLFSDRFADGKGKSPVDGASVGAPGIPEPAGSAPLEAAPVVKPGLVIEPLPDLPSDSPAFQEAPAEPILPDPLLAEPNLPDPNLPDPNLPEPPVSVPAEKPVVIAPLPDTDQPLAVRLARLVPGQIPVDSLRPYHARLVALRARVNEG